MHSWPENDVKRDISVMFKLKVTRWRIFRVLLMFYIQNKMHFFLDNQFLEFVLLLEFSSVWGVMPKVKVCGKNSNDLNRLVLISFKYRAKVQIWLFFFALPSLSNQLYMIWDIQKKMHFFLDYQFLEFVLLLEFSSVWGLLPREWRLVEKIQMTISLGSHFIH